MKQVYQTSLMLTNDSMKLTKELAKYNPGLAINDRESLETLAIMARKMTYNYVELAVDLNKLHERNQINGVNSDRKTDKN